MTQQPGRLDEIEQSVIGAAGAPVGREWSMTLQVCGHDIVGAAGSTPARSRRYESSLAHEDVGPRRVSTKSRTKTAATTTTVLIAAMARLHGARASVPELR